MSALSLLVGGKSGGVSLRQLVYEFFANSLCFGIRNLGQQTLKELVVTQINFLPRRVAKDAIEATLGEDLGECDMPVEEAVLFCELGDFGFEVFG